MLKWLLLWIKVIIFVKENALLKDGEQESMTRKKGQKACVKYKTPNQTTKHIWIRGGKTGYSHPTSRVPVPDFS